MDWTLIVQTITASAVVLVLIAMAVAIVLSVRQNRRLDATLQALLDHNAALLEAATQQTEAARALVEETHEDRAVAARPLLILLDEPPLEIRDQPWAAVRIRNVGNGPALNFVVWMVAGGSLYRSAGAEANGFSGALHLAPGDIFEPGPTQNMLYVGPVHGILDPGPSVVAEHPAANLMAYCGDHFGNRYRFNLRTADPPDVWERGADAPPWAGAWDPRLSSHDMPSDAVPAGLGLPERDLGQLLGALRDILERLQGTAGLDEDVRLTGRGAQRTHDLERRGDFEVRSQTEGRTLR
ncbi:MAG TPA: hypothetical protein VIO13_05945 [Candidatus Dormibacteraeota bacterium]|jgi:hypothetical protein